MFEHLFHDLFRINDERESADAEDGGAGGGELGVGVETDAAAAASVQAGSWNQFSAFFQGMGVAHERSATTNANADDDPAGNNNSSYGECDAGRAAATDRTVDAATDMHHDSADSSHGDENAFVDDGGPIFFPAPRQSVRYQLTERPYPRDARPMIPRGLLSCKGGAGERTAHAQSDEILTLAEGADCGCGRHVQLISTYQMNQNPEYHELYS